MSFFLVNVNSQKMAFAFPSEHNLSSDCYQEVNSNTEVTSATCNVSTGYVTIRHYYNDNFDTKGGISQLNQRGRSSKIKVGSSMEVCCPSIANLAITPL